MTTTDKSRADALTDDQFEDWLLPLLIKHLDSKARHYLTREQVRDGIEVTRVTTYAMNLARAILGEFPASQPAAPPIVSAPASDARECLMDVVSHHHDFVTACKSIKGELHACGAHDSAAYWQKQIDVLDRMKAQAERALATSANETGAEGAQKEAVMLLLQARDELCLIEWEGEDPPERIHTLFDKIEAFVTRSPAMAAEAVAFEITEQAAAEWASRHDVDHVLKHFSTQRNAIEDARTLHLLAAAPQPAQAGARVGLTDEQRDAIDFVIGWYEQSTIADNPYREHIAALRALLSARPAESWQVEIDAYKREVRELEAVLRIPEKMEDDWIRADVQRPIEAGIPSDDDVLAWNNDPGFATIIEASFISQSFPEYTHWKKKPKAPADIDHAKGVDHAE